MSIQLKTTVYLFCISILACTTADDLQNGDIIFQTSLSTQSQAIQLATHSKYSHVGIIYKKAKKIYVFEAATTVKLTPFQEWIDRGQGGHYVVKRLRNADQILTPKVLQKMQTLGQKWVGKPYDLYFEWSDQKMYCSELVWKLYQRVTATELSPLKKLKDFDLSSPLVKQKLPERFGNKIPKEEFVIAPEDIFESDKLVTVMAR